MFRKIFVLVLVCITAAGGFGCGARGKKATASEKTAPLEVNPALQKAQRAETEGQPLTGSQRRMLKDAREDGTIK